MSLHRVELVLEVDDPALAKHLATNGGAKPPYDSDLDEWNGRDVQLAIEAGIAKVDADSEIEYMGEEAE